MSTLCMTMFQNIADFLIENGETKSKIYNKI